MSHSDLNSALSPCGTKLVVVIGAVVPCLLIWLPLSSPELIAFACALTAGITGVISALLWLFASRESADQFSNFAAAAFSGAMTIFGMGAITFPESPSPLSQNIAQVWPWGVYIAATLVVFLVAATVWVKRRPSADHEKSPDGVPTAPKTSSEVPEVPAPEPRSADMP